MKKRLKSIIAVLLIICISCTPKFVFAEGDSEEELAKAREQIAKWAIQFANSPEAAKCDYPTKDLTTIIERRGQTYRSKDPQDKYYFDCVGWVSYAVNRAIGISHPSIESGNKGFVQPLNTNSPNVFDTAHFTPIGIDEIQPGDILVSNRHVGIYVGGDQMVDMQSTLKQRRTDQVTSDSNHVWKEAARLISIDGAHYDPIEGGVELPSGPDIGDGNGGTEDEGTITTDIIDLDELGDQFEYDGMPTTTIRESNQIDVFQWLFEKITGFLSFIVGLLISIIRAPIVGWTRIIEKAINKFLHNLN